MSILDSYKSLRDRKLNLGELVEFHIKSIIESVYRKITLKQKYKNPWSVEISGVIYSDIFIQIYRAIKDYSTAYGRNITTIRDKKGALVSIKIEFIHIGALKLHLKELTGGNIDIKEYFKRKWSNGCSAKIIATEAKPATLLFKLKTHKYTFNLNYTVKNKYGEICSF